MVVQSQDVLTMWQKFRKAIAELLTVSGRPPTEARASAFRRDRRDVHGTRLDLFASLTGPRDRHHGTSFPSGGPRTAPSAPFTPVESYSLLLVTAGHPRRESERRLPYMARATKS